jgi:hypothetical protein
MGGYPELEGSDVNEPRCLCRETGDQRGSLCSLSGTECERHRGQSVSVEGWCVGACAFAADAGLWVGV